jgi:beta-1,4-mannosyltransferase
LTGLRRPLTILAAHLGSHAGGNPDLTLLYEAIRAAGDVEVEPFSVRALVRQRWDVVHIYWPEWCVRRDRGIGLAAVDFTNLLLQLRAARLRGTKIVWSLNNVHPHETDSLGLIDAFLSGFSRVVDLAVCSSQSLLDEFIREYPAIRGAESRVIRPGHYRGVYPDDALSKCAARGKLGLPLDERILLSLGMVRRYKNVIPLVRCYRELSDAGEGGTRLVIAGETLDQDFAVRLRRECEGISSIRLDLQYVNDADLQFYLRSADALIVPTSLATYSGTAMLALSFDCPVVVPRRGTFIEMREALGPSWVRAYEGGIRPSVLRSAFARSRPHGQPALERYYDWSATGREYLRAYLEIAGA